MFELQGHPCPSRSRQRLSTLVLFQDSQEAASADSKTWPPQLTNTAHCWRMSDSGIYRGCRKWEKGETGRKTWSLHCALAHNQCRHVQKLRLSPCST